MCLKVTSQLLWSHFSSSSFTGILEFELWSPVPVCLTGTFWWQYWILVVKRRTSCLAPYTREKDEWTKHSVNYDQFSLSLQTSSLYPSYHSLLNKFLYTIPRSSTIMYLGHLVKSINFTIFENMPFQVLKIEMWCFSCIVCSISFHHLYAMLSYLWHDDSHKLDCVRPRKCIQFKIKDVCAFVLSIIDGFDLFLIWITKDFRDTAIKFMAMLRTEAGYWSHLCDENSNIQNAPSKSLNGHCLGDGKDLSEGNRTQVIKEALH